MPLSDWQNLAETKTLDEDEAAAYFALCRTLSTEQFNRHRIMDLFQATDITFDCTRTLKVLENSDFSLPKDLNALLNLYTKRAMDKMERAA